MDMHTTLPTDPTCTDPVVVNCVACSADGQRLRDITIEQWIVLLRSIHLAVVLALRQHSSLARR